MAIIRTKRTKNFTVLNNDLIRDSRLSFKARGLLQYMLSMPDDWKFYVSELAKHSSKEGESAIKTGLEELEKLGYMRRIQRRESNGKFGAVDWEVLDEPAFSPEVDYPLAEKPTAEKPLADNRQLLRTNSTKNLNNKELNIDREIDTREKLRPVFDFYERNKGFMADVYQQKFVYEYQEWESKQVEHDEIINIFKLAIEIVLGKDDVSSTAPYSITILKNWFNNNLLSLKAIEGDRKQRKERKQRNQQYNGYSNNFTNKPNEAW